MALGTGIIPSGAIGNELTAVTRRAFIPKLIVQIYQASPLLSALLANAQMASGGVSSVVVPVQGTPFVTSQWSDYSGAFNQPAIQQGAYEADFNLCLNITPIPFLGMEGAVQVNAAVIPLIEARMNDAGNAAAATLANALWAAAGANGSTVISSLFDAGGSTSNTFGNLLRTSYSWWVPNVRSVGSSVVPTRDLIMADIASATKYNGGEMPTMGVTSLALWTYLTQDFSGLEQYVITPQDSFDEAAGGARALFTALSVGGVPIYADPYADDNAPGSIVYLNDRYLSFYIHEDAAFAFTGFASTLPNFQLGYVGALVDILQLVLTKSKSMTVSSGYAYLTL